MKRTAPAASPRANSRFSLDAKAFLLDPQRAAQSASMRRVAWAHLMNMRGKRVNQTRLAMMAASNA